jgi:transposase
MPTNFRTGRKPHARCPIDEIIRLEASGLGRAEIAARLGISESSVYRIVVRERRKSGLAPPARRSRWT